MDKVAYISVVRDFAMYGRCVENNEMASSARRVAFDNRAKNEHIPVLYNRFIDSYDYSEPAWFVFCHEDFSPDERLEETLSKLPKDSLYSPIGARTDIRWGIYCKWLGLGNVTVLTKEGDCPAIAGTRVPDGTEVETLDCCCLIVHSSLVHEHGLRFDENLSFDLYVEDFCIAAKELYNIASRVVNFKCRHFSKASPTARYRVQHKYLNGKWKNVSYSSPCSWSIGGKFGLRMITAYIKEFICRIIR